jgi:glycosyltransferase involved in cell wall biosynthesis
MVIYARQLMRMGHVVRIISPPAPTASLAKKIRFWLRGDGWLGDPTVPESHLDGSGVDHHVLDRWRPVTNDDVPDGDVVIATWWETAEWVNALSPNKGAKVYFIQHHEIFPYLPVERCKATYRMPMHKIVVAQWLKDVMRTQYGDEAADVVPNSVDRSQFFAAARGKQGTPTVGMLYSTTHWKGVDVSLAALKRVKKQMENLRVVAFGSERVSPRLPLPDWVEFHYRPHQNELRSLYSRCDVWLCGSRQEGFHLPPMEAMACRCPVVSTRVGGPLDIVEEGINGCLVDVEDSGSLAERLVGVLRLNEVEWQRMSEAALATAARYTWDHAATLLESALRDVIRDQAPT